MSSKTIKFYDFDNYFDAKVTKSTTEILFIQINL